MSMLTTIDNPFDPFIQWEEWLAFDTRAGYNTPAFLARVTLSSTEMTDEEQELAIEEAIDEIVHYNVLGLYRKVEKKKDPGS